jgi:glycerol-3-phosphate acyltransferase PlsX
LKKGFKSSIIAQLGYLLAKRSLNKVLKEMDPNTYNGAMLIGLNGIVVKSHGSADANSFANAINVAISLIENNINDKIVEEIESSSYLQKDYIDDISGAL